MKRRILAVILVLVLAVSVLSGCGLITKNESKVSEKAVVSIGSGTYADKITQTDVSSLFYSYGWYYVYYYGLAVEDVVDLLLDNLLSNKIMIFSATENLPKINKVDKINENNRYDVFFTNEEIADIAARADKYISTKIDETEKEIITDAATSAGLTVPEETVRTTPTNFTYYTTVPVDYIGTDTRSQAVAKYKRLLISDGSSLEEFRNKLILSYKQDALLTKYSDSIKADVNATDADVEARYNTLLAQEKEKYAINADAYKAKLSAIASAKVFSDSNFVLTSPVAGYGFALNLLISFSEEDSAKITAWKEEVKAGTMTKEQYTAKRQELLDNLLVEDQRTSWLKNYGYDSDLFSDNAFNGTATPSLTNNVQNRDEYGNFKYDELSATKYTFTEFLDKLNSDMKVSGTKTENGYTFYNSTTASKETFMNYIWAFGGDSGSFNNSVGYVCYANAVDSSYVDEFAAASTALVGAGEGSYVVVGTDYGYHIIYLIEAYQNVGVNNVYSSSEKDVVGSFSNLFFNSVNDSLKTNYYNERLSAISSAYLQDKNFTKTDDKEKANLVAVLSAAMNG